MSGFKGKFNGFVGVEGWASVSFAGIKYSGASCVPCASRPAYIATIDTDNGGSITLAANTPLELKTLRDAVLPELRACGTIPVPEGYSKSVFLDKYVYLGRV